MSYFFVSAPGATPVPVKGTPEEKEVHIDGPDYSAPVTTPTHLDKTQVRTEEQELAAKQERFALRHALSKGARMQSKPTKVRLVGVPSQYIGTAGTALSFNTNIVMNSVNFPELANFNAVYDEMRIIEVHQEFTLLCTTSATTPTVTYGSAAVEFDSLLANIGVTYGALESRYNTGLMSLFTSVLGNQNPLTNHKVRVHAKMPPGLQPIGANAVAGGWFPIATLPVGFALNGFFASPGGGGVLVVLSFQTVDVEFRMRL